MAFKKGNKINQNREPWNKGSKGIMKKNKTSFKEGTIPWNKEMKGIHLNKKTEFKKGRTPENKLKIGDVVIRGIDAKRRWIKTGEPNKWRLYSNWLWIKHYGEIPEGMIIHHKDRNPLNDQIENYELMNRAQHLNEHREEIQKIKNELNEPMKLR